MPILHSYYQDVYRCPIVRLDGYSAQHGLSTGILAYLDFGGATGSSKDGLAETMLAFATERGTLQPGMPVVEASSGSFGAALAVSCATTGHPCILVVPSNLPIAQRKRLQDLGAHIIACSSSGRRAMERVAEDTAKRYGGYYTHYFSNDDNPEYHRRVTGPQIYKNAGDAIDAIVIGVGSGGTITGVAEYIKAWNSMVRIVAVEPADERGGLPDAALDLGLVQAHVARAVGDVAGAGLLKQLVLGVLHDKADEKAEAAQVCALLPQVPAVHKDAARRWAVQAVEMADKRGFSAARRADDTDKVALLDGEGHVIQRRRRVGHTLVIDVAQVFNTNDFGHSCSFPAGYSPVAVPFRHTWEFFVRVASPKGEAVGAVTAGFGEVLLHF